MRADEQDRVGSSPRGRRRPLLFAVLAALVLGLLAAGLASVLRSTAPGPQVVTTPLAPQDTIAVAPAAPAQPVVPAPTPGTELQPDLPAADPALPPLPALEHSDPEVRSTLADVLPPLAQPVLAPEDLLRRAVSLVAGFARGRVLRDKLPLPGAGGKLLVMERGDRLYLAEANFSRYDALADAVAGLEAEALARWFGRYEPLLAEAWQELGAGTGDVRGALIAGLDIAIAAPDLQGEIELVQPAVFYRYADPALEALPDVQKLLIRMGPANRQVLRQRAQQLRDALAAGR
jgi:hypothetical protein